MSDAKYATCLRCGSPERYEVPTDGDNGQLHLHGTFKDLDATVYACGDCGFVERYITPKHLPLLRERGARVFPVS